MKKLFIVLMILVLAGCAELKVAADIVDIFVPDPPKKAECAQVKQLFFPNAACPSGYSSLGVTGHGASCAEQDTINKIKDYCGGYF